MRSVSFHAYHLAQRQCGEPIFQHLSQRIPCEWVVGPQGDPASRYAGFLLDHTGHQRILLRKRRPAYLFHLPHDLGDLDEYAGKNRKRYMRFDILFVTGEYYRDLARQQLGDSVEVQVIGWPKFDLVESVGQAEVVMSPIVDSVSARGCKPRQ